MRTNLLATLIASTLLCSMLTAQTPKIKPVPVVNTSPTSGEEMFTTYCAVCHGKEGKGNGPAAAALKVAPADLTVLAAHNKGVFPEQSLLQEIGGSEPIAAHGTAEMPVWFDLFRSLGNDRAMIRIRVTNLTNYIKTLQAK